MPGRQPSFLFSGRARAEPREQGAQGWARKSAMPGPHSLVPRSCSEYQAGRATGLFALPASLTLVRGVPNLSLGGNNERKKVAHSGISFDSGSYRVSGGKFRIGTQQFDHYHRRWRRSGSAPAMELNLYQERS